MYSTHSTFGKRWSKTRRALAASIPILWLSGCAGMSNTDKGVLGGAGVGAVTGGIVGHALGNTAAGAVIGTAVGGIAGGVTGASVDNAERKADARAIAAVQQRTALALTDVVQMTQQGVSDNVIIEQIRVSGIVYNLTSQDLVWLGQNGVHEVVIREMQQTAYRVAPPRRFVYGPAPVYVVDPYPPPPIGVGIGFGYGGGHHFCR